MGFRHSPATLQDVSTLYFSPPFFWRKNLFWWFWWRVLSTNLARLLVVEAQGLIVSTVTHWSWSLSMSAAFSKCWFLWVMVLYSLVLMLRVWWINNDNDLPLESYPTSINSLETIRISLFPIDSPVFNRYGALLLSDYVL